MRRAPAGRALFAAVALAGSLGLGGGPALATAAAGCPTSDPCVIVHLPNGHVEDVSGPTITSEAIAAAGQPNGVAANSSYPQRSLPGISVNPDPVPVAHGLSVNALLADLGVNLSTVTFTYMPRPADGTWSILTADELGAAPNSAYADPSLLPVYYADAGSSVVDYARPLLTSATDSNVADNLVQAPELDLFVHNGPLLSVTAHASVSETQTAKIGQPISFTAQATGDAGITPAYTWVVNGTQLSRKQAFTYRFAASGFYQVQVNAAGSDDSAGTAVLFITVGHVRVSGTPAPGSGKSPTPRPRPSQPLTIATPPATTGSSPTAPPSPGVSSAAPGSGPVGHLPVPSAPPAAANGGPPPPQQAPQVAAGLPIVAGRVIGQSAALLSASGAAVDQSSAGVAPATDASGWRAPALLGWIAAIMLLFAAGAAHELGWIRRLRSVVRPR